MKELDVVKLIKDFNGLPIGTKGGNCLRIRRHLL